MPIATDFSFAHDFAAAIMPQLRDMTAPVDLLGPLRPMVGPKPHDGRDAQRTWRGKGFNMIWRPNFGNESGPKDFFLELNFTDEELSFTEITGSGIANRGLVQGTVKLGGAAYVQSIKDSFDHTGQHFEPGVWAHVPATTGPSEPTTVVRMGSVPHGTTINLQGKAITAPKPLFAPASITPFVIGSPDDGATGLVHFPEEILATPSTSRTPLARVAALTQAELSNPNLFLSQAIASQNILSTGVLILSSDTSVPGSVPNAGGGTDNIAFLGPNALAPKVTTIFWLERVRDHNGHEFTQLQYTQRVLLNFKGLSWPHITVATLRHA